MPSLNYNHLRYFRAIAHAGGLTRAAERLNLSQSALSVQLAKLEAQLGHTLFERRGRSLELTEAGRIALDYADTVFLAGEELHSTLAGRPPGQRQPVRVGVITTLSRNFQIEFVRPLLGRSDTEIIVRSGTMRDLLARLESHEVDVVLSNSPARSDAQTLFRSHLIGEQHVAIVAPPGRTGAFRFPHDLAHEPILLPGLESQIRTAFDLALEMANIHPIIVAEVDDMAMLRLMARETDCLALVPPIVVRDELNAGSLVQVCTVPGIDEHFYAITQKRRFPNALVAELIESAGAISPPAADVLAG
jgi:LysR family transcriptional activator of nhaA